MYLPIWVTNRLPLYFPMYVKNCQIQRILTLQLAGTLIPYPRAVFACSPSKAITHIAQWRSQTSLLTSAVLALHKSLRTQHWAIDWLLACKYSEGEHTVSQTSFIAETEI